MAIFHVATNTPPKSELVEAWLAEQPWGPADTTGLELVAGFHLDDPDGEVGMQVFAAQVGDELFHVPLTYRAEPDAALAHGYLGRMEHSVLGARHVYDGCVDPCFQMVVAGVAISGYGQALGFARHDGRWYSVPDEMLIHGHGRIDHRTAVDGWTTDPAAADGSLVLANDTLEMTVHRQLVDRPTPASGLSATWAGQNEPLVLVEVRSVGQERNPPHSAREVEREV